MDKKLYIQPQTEITKIVSIQMLADSGVTGTGSAEIDWGGEDPNPEAGGDVKGESWTNIWD